VAGGIELSPPGLADADGTGDGDDDADGDEEALGVGAGDDGVTEPAGLCGAELLGCAEGVLDGCVTRGCDLCPLTTFPTLVPVACLPQTTASTGLPTDISKMVITATTTRNAPSVVPP
jgi:hypothetical protein